MKQRLGERLRATQPCMNADGANRPGGTRPKLLTLVVVQGWFGANPPRWLCARCVVNFRLKVKKSAVQKNGEKTLGKQVYLQEGASCLVNWCCWGRSRSVKMMLNCRKTTMRLAHEQNRVSGSEHSVNAPSLRVK